MLAKYSSQSLLLTQVGMVLDRVAKGTDNQNDMEERGSRARANVALMVAGKKATRLGHWCRSLW